MRYCAECKRPRDRKDNRTGKGQRLCKQRHAADQRKHRAKMKRERQVIARFIQRVGIENGVVP